VTATAPQSTQFARFLSRETLNPNPFAQFERWFDDARKAAPTGSMASAMSLATNSPEGVPAVRTVLLKYHDEDGFVFFTEARTRKTKHIASNPVVSLLFPWLALNRQVIITGKAEKLSSLAAMRCLLMGESNGNRAMIESQLAEIKTRLASGTFSLPSFVAFRVKPDVVEFWQGRGPREHDHFLYTRQESGEWSISQLD
jgi:pyridoxamine 5'-phosphate oxidase